MQLTTPAVVGSSPLAWTTVKDTNASSWNLKVEVVRLHINKVKGQERQDWHILYETSQWCYYAKVSTGVGDLNDHLLTVDGARGEGELVALAAPVVFRRSLNVGGGEAVGNIVGSNEGHLCVANVRV
jgi:hypothetical protein